MVYKNMEELNNNYKNERQDMSLEEHKNYVRDCFDTLEKLGFKTLFDSIYDDSRAYNGMKFEVKRRLIVDEEADLEVLPMWHILLENGVELDAYPEEICI